LPEQNTVALITARGGSKRLPGKNTRLLSGKPLIAWTIEAALSANSIERVIVSTDAPAIAKVAKEFGAEVPFVRPQKYSGDYASHYDVIAHALDWLDNNGQLPQTCVLLQPTSPFRTGEIIDKALAARARNAMESLASVKAVKDTPGLMYRLSDGGAMSSYLAPNEEYQRTQDQEPLFVLNGAIYAFCPVAFAKRSSVLSTAPGAYVMDEISSLDIDNAEDFTLAEALVQAVLD